MGEIDPLGSRRDGLDAFLDRKVDEGYEVETRTDTHAIIFRRPKGLKRFTSGKDQQSRDAPDQYASRPTLLDVWRDDGRGAQFAHPGSGKMTGPARSSEH